MLDERPKSLCGQRSLGEVMPIRAVIYARYSSEHQREASIVDQVRLCEERIEREGWVPTGTFQDAGISGATPLRAGYRL